MLESGTAKSTELRWAEGCTGAPLNIPGLDVLSRVRSIPNMDHFLLLYYFKYVITYFFTTFRVQHFDCMFIKTETSILNT